MLRAFPVLRHAALGLLALALLAVGVRAQEVLPAEIDRCPFTGRFPVEITLDSPVELSFLEHGRFDIDQVHGLIVTVYVTDAELSDLRAAGFHAVPIPNQARRAWAEEGRDGREAYHTYDTLTAELQQIAAAHPDIVQLRTIGASYQGRELWMMKLSDNVTLDEPEPEFKYSAAIHGNEPVGMEMCVYLIRLLVDNYGTDPELTALVNDLEIYICPLHNPDGNANGTRYNAQGYDLNRSFPDPYDDPVDDPAGRPIEVQRMMYFQYAHNIILGVNFHTGALVVNYPWDSLYGQYTPDDEMFLNLSLGYSVLNPPMWNSSEFENGVTIGWDWYVIHGGMQDWAYNWRNEVHVTIEQSNSSWPPASQLAQLWENNREAMLWYMAQARIGVEGFATDASNGSPIKATVEVIEINKPMWGEPAQGYYHRLLEAGTYTLEFSAENYVPLTVNNVVVTAGTTTHLDVQLQPVAIYTVSGMVTDAADGTPLAATVAARRHDTGQLVNTTTGGSDGSYALTVPTGEYDLEASAPDHIAASETHVVAADLTLDFALEPTRGQALVVSDNNAATLLPGALRALGFEVTEETISTTNAATWGTYDLLVWSAGSSHNPVAVSSIRTALESHVATGRKLLIEGGELGYDATRTPGYPSFAENVLHISNWHVNNAGHLPVLADQADHALATIPNTLPGTIEITYNDYGDEDAVVALTDAVVVYGTTSYPTDAGILTVEEAGGTAGQIVYYAFDYAALTSSTVASELLENTIQFLLPGNQGAPEPDAVPLWLSEGQPSLTRGEVTFRVMLPVGGVARAAIYDVSGRLVRSLLTGEVAAGPNALRWDGCDAMGGRVAPGVYFLRASAPVGDAARRIVIVK
jgi:hypothetical protein